MVVSMSEAEAAVLRNKLLGIALEEWEREQGPFTEDELARAAEMLNLERPTQGPFPAG